jgi:hypothetical protein
MPSFSLSLESVLNNSAIILAVSESMLNNNAIILAVIGVLRRITVPSFLLSLVYVLNNSAIVGFFHD